MTRISTYLLLGLLLNILHHASLSAQIPEFQRELSSIPVIENGVPLLYPFAGGLDDSKPAFVDIDDDGDLDLFVGGFIGSIKFFRNIGTGSDPNYMPEALPPLIIIPIGGERSMAFADIDNDGDFDLLLGNRLHRNQGTASNPFFISETQDLVNFLGSFEVPTFADIDNDGDLDLFIGEFLGNINFFRNTGTASVPIFTLETENFASIDVGSRSTPSFADIDNDGDLDLFVGEFQGNINFYRNAGTAADPVFTLETENFVEIIDGSSASTPALVDLNNDGDLDLFTGEFDGYIYYYQNIGTASNPEFVFETDNFVSIIDIGNHGTPAFADIDNDNDPDLFMGDGSGSLYFYRNTGMAADPIFMFETETFASIDVGFGVIPAPAFADIDNDGDLDLFVGEGDGNINFFRNVGSASVPIFIHETENFNSINVGGLNYPTFADIDNDGDLDLFIGVADGIINFYRNTGTASDPVFTLETENFNAIDIGSRSVPIFTDIDNDGDLDLFVGESLRSINFYLNTGSASDPVFILETENFTPIDVDFQSYPTFTDIDNDGDPDLFVGESWGGLLFYRNLFNYLPVISGLPECTDFYFSDPLQLNIWDYVEDVETSDGSLAYQFFSTNDSLLIDFNTATGILTLSAQGNFRGDALISMIIIDEGGSQVEDSIRVIVTAVPGGPLAVIAPDGPTTLCEGQSVGLVASGGTTYVWNTGAITSTISVSTSGIFSVTVTNGCTGEDVASQAVTVNQPATSSIEAVICKGEAFTLGDSTYTVAGPYIYTVPQGAANGCDSIITLELEVLAPGIETIEAAICEGEIFILNDVQYTAAGQYTDIIPGGAVNGCDSLLILDLAVHPLPAPGALSGNFSPNVLSVESYSVSGSPGSSFQWTIEGGVQVSGGTTNMIEVEWSDGNTGMVCVQETDVNNCTGEEFCQPIDLIVGIDEKALISKFNIYPNPVAGQLNIELEFGKAPVSVRLTLLNPLGQVILGAEYKSPGMHLQKTLSMENLPSGIYLMSIQADDQVSAKKISVIF